jgi:FkbM family methyltransferase
MGDATGLPHQSPEITGGLAAVEYELEQIVRRLPSGAEDADAARRVDVVAVLEHVRALRESEIPVGNLDYPGARIVMGLASKWAVKRLHSCSKEPWTVDWIERAMRPGDAFYDVGASVGPYALVAHAAFAGGVRVVAIEPAVASFAVLCGNIVRNGAAKTIVPLPVALASMTGRRDFHYRSVEPGAAMHSLSGERHAAATDDFVPVATQTVLTYRLDDLLSTFSLPSPSHLKLDVDGAELSVLEGAQRTLRDPHLRSVMVELDLDQGEEIARVLGEAGLHARTDFERRVKDGTPVPHWYALFERQ